GNHRIAKTATDPKSALVRATDTQRRFGATASNMSNPGIGSRLISAALRLARLRKAIEAIAQFVLTLSDGTRIDTTTASSAASSRPARGPASATSTRRPRPEILSQLMWEAGPVIPKPPKPR